MEDFPYKNMDRVLIFYLHISGVEIWMPVTDYEGYYSVSNFGNIKSHLTDKILIFPSFTRGYRQVGLYKDMIKKEARIGRVVLLAFMPEKYQQGFEADHIDLQLVQ